MKQILIEKIELKYNSKPIKQTVTLDEAIEYLMKFSSVENRTPELLKIMLLSEMMICTNFHSFQIVI